LAPALSLLLLAAVGPEARAQRPLPNQIVPPRAALNRVGLELSWYQVVPQAQTERLMVVGVAGSGLWGGSGVVLDAPATPSSFAGDAGLHTIDDFYKNVNLVITDGPLKGQSRQVNAYDGRSRTFRFADPFPQAPEDGAPFELREGNLVVAKGKVHAAPATVDTFLSGTAFSPIDDLYAGADLLFTSGDLKGQASPIASYQGASRRFKLYLPLSKAPASGDRFSIRGAMIFAQTDHAGFYAYDAESGRYFWRTDLGRITGQAQAAALNSSEVYATNGLTIHAVDRVTGRLRWEQNVEPSNTGQTSFRPGSFASSPAAASEERVIVGLSTGRLIAFNLKDLRTKENPYGQKPGTLAWTWQTDGPVSARPIVGGNIVVFASQDKKLYVARDHPKSLFLRFPTDGPISASMGTHGNRTVLVPSEDGNLYAVDIFNGHQFWVHSTGAPIDQEPLVGDDDVYVVNNRGALSAIDINTGENRWTFPSGAEHLLAVSGSRVYLRSEYGDLIVVDRKTGAILFDANTTRDRAGLNLRDYTVVQTNRLNDRIYLATPTGVLICLREIGHNRPLLVRHPSAIPFGWPKAPTAKPDDSQAQPKPEAAESAKPDADTEKPDAAKDEDKKDEDKKDEDKSE
jgi:outer membrane protein assembly factor BamB